MNRTYVILGLVLLCAWTQRAHSQSPPLKGIVWDAPVPPTPRHLLKMHEAGVEAVRLPWVTNNALLEVADTLGLQLFQDISLDYLPVDVLLDSLEYAKRMVWQATLVSLLHPSAQHFGVSTKSDTSTPRACEYLNSLQKRLPSSSFITPPLFWNRISVPNMLISSWWMCAKDIHRRQCWKTGRDQPPLDSQAWGKKLTMKLSAYVEKTPPNPRHATWKTICPRYLKVL